MKRIYKIFVFIALFLFTFKFNVQASGFGEYAIYYLEQISRIPRVSFSDGEVYTADYLRRLLRDFGYDTIFEEISFPEDTVLNFTQGYYLSHNIIATKKGASDLEVIIGTSYDSEDVNGSTGFEGATGVSVLLEIAERVKDMSFPFTLKFVLFGSGKNGEIGPTHYVSTRSQDELNNIMYFLDITSLGSGKNLYIYGNSGNKGFVRDELLALSKDLKIDLFTPEGNLEEGIPFGVWNDIGDHVAFKYSNVPFGKIEATSLESLDEMYGLPDDPTGEGVGIIEGSSNDNYDYVMNNFIDNVEKNLSNSVELVFNYLVREDRSIKIITQLSEENIDKISQIKYELYSGNKKLKEISLDETLITEFKDLDEGNYTVKVVYPKEIEFLKDIEEFDFNFEGDLNGKFVFVNDEIVTYTYRKEFTDNYNSVREDIKNSKFEIRAKKLLFDYSSGVMGDYEEEDDSKNEMLIKTLAIVLIVLIACYVLLKIILSKINKND